MLSTSSLTAFSAAPGTVSPQRPGPVRLARNPAEGVGPLQAGPPDKLPPIGGAQPGLTPRGSLLNLSV